MMKVLEVKKNIIATNEIPEFTLLDGEICGIFILNGADPINNDIPLIDFLTLKKVKKEITTSKPFYQVKDFFYKKTFLDRLTKKHLVRKLIKSKLKCNDSKVIEILDKLNLKYDSSQDSYEGNIRRMLSTLIALEKHKNVIYDTVAISTEGIIQLNKLVKEKISKQSGCAIEINFHPKEFSSVPLKNYDVIIEIKSV